jgi:hypothetical protein
VAIRTGLIWLRVAPVKGSCECGFQKLAGSSWVAAQLPASQEELSSVKLVISFCFVVALYVSVFRVVYDRRRYLPEFVVMFLYLLWVTFACEVITSFSIYVSPWFPYVLSRLSFLSAVCCILLHVWTLVLKLFLFVVQCGQTTGHKQ